MRFTCEKNAMACVYCADITFTFFSADQSEVATTKIPTRAWYCHRSQRLQSNVLVSTRNASERASMTKMPELGTDCPESKMQCHAPMYRADICLGR